MSLPREEDDDNPTLVGQLKLVRESYGEGFDEDIAKPLARILVKLRKGMEAWQSELEDDTHLLQSKVDELESQLEEAPDPETITRMEEDLRDVRRGLLDLDELFDRWDVGVTA